MENGAIPGVDFAEMQEKKPRPPASRSWPRCEDWDPLGRTAKSACPWSYPVAE